jgi:hypothetical protein
VRLFHLKLFKCPTTNNQDKKKKAQDRNVIHFIFPASPSKEISNHPRVAILVAILYIDDEYSILVTVYQIKNQPAGKRNGEINSMDAFNRGRQHTHTHIRDRTPFFFFFVGIYFSSVNRCWTVSYFGPSVSIHSGERRSFSHQILTRDFSRAPTWENFKFLFFFLLLISIEECLM